MTVTFVPFGEYRPAGSKHGDGLSQADNVLPLFAGLYPIRGLGEAIATVVDGPVTGGHAHVWPSGSGTTSYVGDAVTLFAGTKEHLYSPGGFAFNVVERAALYGQALGAAPCGWRFASFGNDIWATNYSDPIQRRTNNAGLFANGITSTFAPQARLMAAVREFMFVADLNPAAPSSGNPDEFAWSDVDDPTWYDPGVPTAARPTSVAGRKRIVTRPGQFMGLVGGAAAVLFKRNSVHGVSFIGGSDIWRVDELAYGVGTAYPGSIVDSPTGIYFWDGRHFRRQLGLAAPEIISPPAIDQILIDNYHFLDQTIVHDLLSTLSAEDGIMRGWYGERTGIIYWTWANISDDPGGTSPPGSQFSHIRGFAYNPELGAWSMIRYSDLDLAMAVSIPPTATPINSNFMLDRFSVFSYDPAINTSTWWQLSDVNIEATIRTKRDALALNGATGQAIKTRIKGILPVFTVPDNGRSYIPPAAMPTVPNVSVTITAYNEPHGVSQVDADATVVSPRTSTMTMNANGDSWGWMPTSIEGRWYDYKFTIPAGSEWISCPGFYVDWEAKEPAP